MKGFSQLSTSLQTSNLTIIILPLVPNIALTQGNFDVCAEILEDTFKFPLCFLGFLGFGKVGPRSMIISFYF